MQQPLGRLASITLETAAGLRVEVLPYGATIKSITVNNQIVTLTYPKSEDFLSNPYYFGSTIGRYANRLANGRFSLNGQLFNIEKGDNPHALHGGAVGFSHRLWQCLSVEPQQCVLYYYSPEGESGFPGALHVYLTISVSVLTVDLEYRATTSADTVISLTNHCYFNLNGDLLSATEHLLKIDATHFLPCVASGIPTGVVSPVENSVFDFRTPTLIADRLKQVDPNLEAVNGFDHYFVFAKERDISLPVAELSSRKTGIKLQLYTTQPGLQFYAGNFLTKPFQARSGICLEAQHWPDAPNQSHFPPATIAAGDTYQQRIRYQFSYMKSSCVAEHIT